MAIASSHTLVVLIAVAVIICVANALYNVFLHPLCKFPGPLLCRATPFYRHFKFLSGVLQFNIKSWHDTYGPVVRISPNELSFISPQAWRDIYLPLTDPNGPAEMEKYDKYYRFAGPGTPDTLVTVSKKVHGPFRRQINLAFSERALRMQEPTYHHYTNLLIRKLHVDSKCGTQLVNLCELFNYYTFDMIGNLGIGSDFGGLEHSTYHPWVKAMTHHVKEMAFIQTLTYLGFSKLVQMITSSSLLKGKVEYEQLTKEKLLSRMSRAEERADLVEPFLKLKEPLTFDELLANVHILIIAGSESSASVLTVTVSLFADNPEVLRKATDEVRSTFQNEDEITMVSANKLHYLFACLNESLRRFPPSPVGLPRVTPPGGATICGYEVPENAVVAVSQWAAYHSAENFTDPMGYHPERHLKDPRFAQDHLDALQPFGLGHRSCPGRTLSFAETRLALARILWNFDIESTPSCRDWIGKQKAYILWDKQEFWAYLKPVREVAI
ncbi:cytochrome P450 [Thelonectria olida]|uniref:Cytochrome P450 n=1 Tax=Thelonectria olida TaxID=1576542 RepID=A0A9P8VN03_9HYPO|nr:cytochrome P450 [Thelonectria olida]